MRAGRLPVSNIQSADGFANRSSRYGPIDKAEAHLQTLKVLNATVIKVTLLTVKDRCFYQKTKKKDYDMEMLVCEYLMV